MRENTDEPKHGLDVILDFVSSSSHSIKTTSTKLRQTKFEKALIGNLNRFQLFKFSMLFRLTITNKISK